MSEVSEARPLRVFNNDYDTVAVYDLDDLRRWYVEEQGMLGPEEFEPQDWEELPLEQSLTIRHDPDDWAGVHAPEPVSVETRDGVIYATATVAAWVSVGGRGMLCSTEY